MIGVESTLGRVDILRCVIENGDTNGDIYEAEIAEKLYGDRSSTANLASALTHLETKYDFPYIKRGTNPCSSSSLRKFVRLIRTYPVIQAIWVDREYEALREVIFRQPWVHERLLEEVTGVPVDVKNYIRERCETSQFLFTLLMDNVTRQETVLELTEIYNKFSSPQRRLDQLAEIHARHTLLKPLLEAIYYWRLLDVDHGMESDTIDPNNIDPNNIDPNNIDYGRFSNFKNLTVLLIELDDIFDSIRTEPDDLSLRIYLDRFDSLIVVLNYMFVRTSPAHDVKKKLKYECAYDDMLEEIHRWFLSLYTSRYTPSHPPPPPTKRIASEFK